MQKATGPVASGPDRPGGSAKIFENLAFGFWLLAQAQSFSTLRQSLPIHAKAARGWGPIGMTWDDLG